MAQGTDVDCFEPDGGIFLSDKFPGKCLKRWFKTHKHLIEPTIDFFTFCRQLINQADLAGKIMVPTVEERGSDWVQMDYDSSGVPVNEIKDYNDELLQRLLAECKKINSTQSSYLQKMIEQKSSFLRHSFVSGKLIIGGLEIY